jgi:uncharacterized RDD family membrane protein YckC
MTDRDLQQKRMVAAAIDIGVALVIFTAFWVLSLIVTYGLGRATGNVGTSYIPRLLGFAGSVLSLGYILGRDLVAGGRSLGKQLQGIRVVTTGGGPIGMIDSVKRNAVFAIGSALGLVSATLQLVPCLGDIAACIILPLQILGGLISLGLAIFEMIKISQDPEGIRLGDQMANTRVVR